MHLKYPRHLRLLSVSPSTRGFGFAVLDGDALVDWGVKSVKGEKNSACLKKIEKLISHYLIEVIVLEDHRRSGVRRAPRIQLLNNQILDLASNQNLKRVLLSRKEIRRVFFEDGKGTKYGVAKVLTERFQDDLGIRLPPKRNLWNSEHYRMGIFDAVALVLACALKKRSPSRHLEMDNTFALSST